MSRKNRLFDTKEKVVNNPFLHIAQGISLGASDHIWEEKPVSISEFIENKKFLNQKWNGRNGCRPKIMEIAENITKDNVRECMLLLGKGSGKDYIASIIHLYGVYRCLCMANPQSYFGLGPSPIYFINTARNEKQAKKVFFLQMLALLSECPWFEGKYREPPGVDSIIFDKGIQALSVNSQAFGWLGFNTIQWVGDELAFFLENDTDEESASRAEECWHSAFGSCKTRFPLYYKMIGITTPRFDDDFVMKKFYELKARPQDSYVAQAATWDIHPHLSKEDFKHQFEVDYRRTMRDFGAVPVGVIESFWPDPSFVEDSVCETCRQCPIYQKRKEITDIFCCNAYEDCHANGYKGNGYWRDWFAPPISGNDYWMHFDLAKSKDRIGFALSRVMGESKVELDTYKLVEKYGESYKKETITEEEKFQVKPLIKVDAVGFITTNRSMDSRLLKNGEYYYKAIMDHLILDIQRKKFNIVGISFDQFQCLNEETTYVKTKRGFFKLKEIKIGDEIWTRFGYKKVLNRFEYKQVPSLIFKTSSNTKIEGTMNHRMLVKKIGEINFRWVEMQNIEKGDIIALNDDIEKHDKEYIELETNIPRRWRNSRIYNLPSKLNEDLAEFLGLLFGNGCMQLDHGNFGICCGSKNDVDLTVNSINKTFGINPRFRDKNYQNKGTDVIVSSTHITDFLVFNDLHKKTKAREIEIPGKILFSKKSVICAFLRGMFTTDGSVDKNDGACILVSMSEKMIHQVKYLIQTLLGLRATITEVELDGSDGCFGQFGTKYQMRINGSRELFLNEIGFLGEKNEKLKLHKNKKGRKLFDRVYDIIPSVCNVVDIDVEDCHEYIANGLISHNSHFFKQDLEDRGFQVELISCDRTDEVPVAAKYALIEQRVEYPYCYVLCDEAKNLKYIEGKKVDHVRKSSKDVFDAFGSTIFCCEKFIQSQSSFEMLNGDDDD